MLRTCGVCRARVDKFCGPPAAARARPSRTSKAMRPVRLALALLVAAWSAASTPSVAARLEVAAVNPALGSGGRVGPLA